MHQLFTVLIDSIFPPGEEERIVRAVNSRIARALYHEQKESGWTALSSFRDSTIRALIHEAKYENSAHAQSLLGELVEEYRIRHPEKQNAVWIPIPLSQKRERLRGYNQVTSVLTHANITVDSSVLRRTRDTKPQTDLDKRERLLNMHDAFECLLPEQVRGQDIILIDDVVTTGATLRACDVALAPHDPRSITLIAIAH